MSGYDAIAFYGFTAADLGLSRGGKNGQKPHAKAKPKAAKGAESSPNP